MAVIRADAVICTVRNHGEHGAVVRCLTADHGLQSGYVRGARSRLNRPIFMPGNVVAAEYRSRNDSQLSSLTAELLQSGAPYFAEPLAASAFGWVTLLTGSILPESQPFARVYDGLAAVLELICVSPSARWWAKAMVEYELYLLSALGFGLDLSQCALTGDTHDLQYVSPKSGRAVSAAASGVYANLLLPLPSFLIREETPDWPQILQAFDLTGHFLERAFFNNWRHTELAARDHMLDRLKRVVA